MAKKATEHERIIRVHEIYRLLTKGASRYRILRYSAEKWQVSERTSEIYLAEARALLARDLEIERPKWLEQSVAELQEWRWQELNPADRDEGVTTSNRLAALQFLKAQAALLQFEMS